MDSLFCYIAAAHGLHAAGEEARTAGDQAWAAELHSLGQLFLHYATGDINAIVTAGHSCRGREAPEFFRRLRHDDRNQ